MEKVTITLTANQAHIILRALNNESNDDVVGRGEYSYWRCCLDVYKKLKKAGFKNDYWNWALGMEDKDNE